MKKETIEDRFSTLEHRLTLIEEKLSVRQSEEETVVIQPSDEERVSPVSAPINFKITEPFELTMPSQPGNWLGIIAMICFILAAGFIIKLSIDSGWLTPARQVVIASLFGFSLIGLGFLQTTYKEYASYLPAAGITILFLAVFAAHRLYALLTVNQALALIVLVALGCIGLFIKFRQDVYAILAVTGAYVAPVLLDFQVTCSFTVYYFLCCSMFFAVLSVVVSSRLLTLVAANLSILMTALIGSDLMKDNLIIVALAGQFVSFSVSTFAFSVYHSKRLSEGESWGFFPVLLLFYAAEYYFIDRLNPSLAPWISLLFAAFIITLYLFFMKWMGRSKLQSQAMIVTYLAIVFFHSFYLELLPELFKPWLMVVILLIVAVRPLKSSIQTFKTSAYVPLFLSSIIVGLESLSMLYYLWHQGPISWLWVDLATFASLCLVMARNQDLIQSRDGNGYLLLVVAHVLAISGLYRLTYPHGSFAVTASWLLYAVFIISVAYYRKEKVMAKSALLVLALSAGKALLYDAASTPTAVRIFCLLFTGAVLYGSGFMMKKIAEWENKEDI